jgi:DNA topoisomerase-3
VAFPFTDGRATNIKGRTVADHQAKQVADSREFIALPARIQCQSQLNVRFRTSLDQNRMSKTVIIAEKPSVATDLARVLGKLPDVGKFEKKTDYFENDTAIVTSAIGHLVGLKMPTKEDGKKLPWSMTHLPHVPKEFELEPIERSLPRFKLLVKLLKRKDVDTVVNACDAGREGELIFRYLMQMADVNKDFPMQRMWMQSMTDGAILDAW